MRCQYNILLLITLYTIKLPNKVVNSTSCHNVQHWANIYTTSNWQSSGMHVEHQVNKRTCVHSVLHCVISRLPFLEGAWSMQLYSRSCGSLAKVWYGPEIKSSIKAGSWCIKLIFWENRGLNRQKSASLCMFWAQFWTFLDKKTSPYLLTTWLCKRNIFRCHAYANNLTSFPTIWQCYPMYYYLRKWYFKSRQKSVSFMCHVH